MVTKQGSLGEKETALVCRCKRDLSPTKNRLFCDMAGGLVRSSLFDGSNVNVTTEGRRLIGAAIGSKSFVTDFISKGVSNFSKPVQHLAELATSQPQAAHTVFTRWLSSEWTFVSRVMKDTNSHLTSLEPTIRKHFLPALTGCQPPGDLERELFALPARHGGLGVANPAKCAELEFANSVHTVAPLTEM